MKFITEANIKGKKVLLRADFNVEVNDKQQILSDFRLRAVLATINFLLDKGSAKIILMSHLGKPKGKEEKLSLKPIAEHLAELLNKKVIFLKDCLGEKIRKEIDIVDARSVFERRRTVARHCDLSRRASVLRS